jgi:hypothetical protein
MVHGEMQHVSCCELKSTLFDVVFHLPASNVSFPYLRKVENETAVLIPICPEEGEESVDYA